MLNIEVIKFEAQDVITASVAACTHDWGSVAVSGTKVTATCNDCGVTGTLAADGQTFVPNK